MAVKSWADLGLGIVGSVHVECQFESVVTYLVTVGSDFFRPRGEVVSKSVCGLSDKSQQAAKPLFGEPFCLGLSSCEQGAKCCETGRSSQDVVHGDQILFEPWDCHKSIAPEY